MSLTPAELRWAAALGNNLAADWMELEAFHTSDTPDVIQHIHALQNIVMARAAQRDHPIEFPRLAHGTNRHPRG